MTSTASNAAGIKVQAEQVNAWFGDTQILKGIDMAIPEKQVTAVIGPSGCGKSTFIRCINRMHELVDIARFAGRITLDGQDVYGDGVDPVLLRRLVGMVFQKPNPFPKSIYENIAYAPRIHGDVSSRAEMDELVETTLRQAGLWEEVSDRLHTIGTSLSGGQQQRLCIARALAVQPEVILMDEPCSALDPIATATIEDLIVELKEDYTVIIVTHNMQEAARVSDLTAFFYLGELIELDSTKKIFSNPENKRTQDYIAGRFG